jgi:lipooligosaccharide transport system permease protein
MNARPPTGLVRGTLRVAYRHLLVWRHNLVSNAVGYVGEPLLYLGALGYGLGRLVPNLEGMTYAEFIAPGLVCSTVMYTASFEGTFGSYTRLETQGTFEAMLATPISVAEVVAGEIVFAAVKAALGGTFVLVVAAAFGLVPSLWSLGIPLVAFVAGLLFAAIALAVTSQARSYEGFNYFFTLLLAPMYLFSGVFFPMSQLPSGVQIAAQLLPLTHVVELSRALVRGTLGAQHLANVVAVALFLVPAYWIGFWGISRRVQS